MTQYALEEIVSRLELVLEPAEKLSPVQPSYNGRISKPYRHEFLLRNVLPGSKNGGNREYLKIDSRPNGSIHQTGASTSVCGSSSDITVC
jgi:hypothetical protein